MLLLGNRSLSVSQCSWTNAHARAPCSRLPMARASRYGAFWVRTSSVIAHGEQPVDQLGLAEVGQRVEVAQLLLRGGGAS